MGKKKIYNEMESAQLENVTSEPAAGKKGRIIFNTSDSTARIDNGSDWQSLGGGGAPQYTAAYAGEDIDTTNNDKAVNMRQKNMVEIVYTSSWLDIDEGGGEVSTQILPTDNDVNKFLIDDLGRTQDEHDLCYIIETALNNNGSLNWAYTCSLITGTYQVRIGASNTFALLGKTGVHGTDNGDNNIENAIGFDDSVDHAIVNPQDADNFINDFNTNNSLIKTAWIFKTDTAYLISAQNFDGFVNTTATKAEVVTVNQYLELTNFSNIVGGTKYYTIPASIVIDSSNEKIDFKEGAGAELTGTIANDTYLRGVGIGGDYAGLNLAIKTAMEAVGSLVYTPSYTGDTNLFKIDASSVCTLLTNTGTNAPGGTATAIYTTIGYSAITDTSSLDSHEGDNAIDLAGEIGIASEADSNSVYVGKGTNDNNLYTEKNFSVSDYAPVFSSPGDWKTTPTKSGSRGAAYNLHCQHENSSGKGLRVYQTPSGSWFVEFKNGNGLPWQAATDSWASGATPADDINNGDYRRLAKCFVDEQGRGIVSYSESDSNVRWSDDLDNWSAEIVIRTGASDYFVKGIDIRDEKAILLVVDGGDSDSKIYYSTYSSGWGSWSSYDLTKDFIDVTSGACYIQAYPAAAANFQYRYCAVGYRNADADTVIEWCDVNGANSGNAKFNDQPLCRSVGIDKFGTKNRIVCVSANGGAVSALEVNATDDVSGATITIANAGVGVDVNSGLSNLDFYNGYSTTDGSFAQRLHLATERRVIVLGENTFVLDQTDSGTASKKQVNFYRTTNISAGTPTWVSPEALSPSGVNAQECCMQYIASTHSLLVAWKEHTQVISSNLSYGQIYTRLGEIQLDGSISWHDAEQVDGGEGLSGFQGFLQSSSSADGVSLSWEEGATSTGATNETWDNYFI